MPPAVPAMRHPSLGLILCRWAKACAEATVGAAEMEEGVVVIVLYGGQVLLHSNTNGVYVVADCGETDGHKRNRVSRVVRKV